MSHAAPSPDTSPDTPPTETASAADTSPTVADRLTAILAAIEAGEERAPLAGRLVDIGPSLTGSAEEAALLTKISAYRGWARIVAELPRPAKVRPKLRLVREGEEMGEGEGEGGEGEGGGGWRTPPNGLPDGWVDPPGWICSVSGVWCQKKTPEGPVLVKATESPLWIGRRWADVETGEWTVDIRWPGGSQIVSRQVALDGRRLIELAGRGAPVSSAKARGAVAWLEISEKKNERVVPVHTSISHLGWTDSEGARALQTADGPHLLRAEDGHAQTARALTTAGTWEEWVALAKRVNANPIPAIMLAASVASILLEPCGAPPFVIDLHGLTSKGKTTALRWAASAWADPRDGGAYILPWEATPAAIEGRAGFLHNLPVCLDDTKKIKAENRPAISSIIYGWSAGQGKARARPDGTRPLTTWRSMMLSTGEAPLSILGGENGGMRLRILSLTGQPFPEGAPEVALINDQAAPPPFGHVGPCVAAWAIKRWTELPKMWSWRKATILKELGSTTEANRIAGYLALLTIGRIALREIGVPLPAEKAMKEALLESGRNALLSSDIAGSAWHHIQGWLVSQEARIHGATGRTESLYGGWIGRVVRDGIVGVLPRDLEPELVLRGIDPAEIIPQWVQRGYLATTIDGGRPTPKIVTRWKNGQTARMYHLKIDGWTEYQPPTPPPPSDRDHRW